MKRLYFEEDEDHGKDDKKEDGISNKDPDYEDNSYKKAMFKQLKSNSETAFSYGYCYYVFMTIFSKCCCCICQKYKWYQRNLLKLRKIKLAHQKVY